MPGDSRCLRVKQDAADECQPLLQRMEVRRLPRDHMLDAPLPGKWVPWGLGTKLHHKGPIGRERQWELGHGRPPALPHPGRAFSCYPWPTRQGAVEKIAACSCAGRYTMLSVQDHTPKRSNVGVRCPGSVQRLFKLQRLEIRCPTPQDDPG